jgi:hypothetical protein
MKDVWKRFFIIMAIIGGLLLLAKFNPQPTEAERQWNEQVKAAIAEHRVLIGMTAKECEQAFGRPKRINRTVRSSLVSEQWVYDRGNGVYLHLDNGVLRTIQDSR